MDWCMSKAIKTQDFFYPMNSVRSSNDLGADVAWKWVNEHIEDCRARIAKASPSLLAAVVNSCAAGGITATRAEEIAKLFGKYPSLTRNIANLVEATKATAAFVERTKDSQASKNADFWLKISS